MKKTNIKEKFFEELRNIPIVQVACEKTGVSRNSVYRWKKEDKDFSRKMDEAMADGVAFVNDMSESQLLTMIKEKNWSAISFWLKHRNDNYKNKLEITAKEDYELTEAEQQTVGEALRFANKLLEKNHEKAIQNGRENTKGDSRESSS